MPGSHGGTILHHLQRYLIVRELAERTDAQLLQDFASARDEAAFATLVRRHGPMVLSVCRRVLGDPLEAEDAFQATFLVLVKKAGSLGQPERVASWLYGVAYRTARKARAQAQRRPTTEADLTSLDCTEPIAEAVWQEVRAILDDEIQGLPEKYRLPVVLCLIQGKTQRQVARELGWPDGTVATRLLKAREILRSRLDARGLSLSGGVLAAGLAQASVRAAVGPATVAATVRAALAMSAGATSLSAVSSKAIALSQGVLQAMFLAKIKSATIVVLGAALLGFGAGGAWRPAEAQDASPNARVSPVPAKTAPAENPSATWRIAQEEDPGGGIRALTTLGLQALSAAEQQPPVAQPQKQAKETPDLESTLRAVDSALKHLQAQNSAADRAKKQAKFVDVPIVDGAVTQKALELQVRDMEQRLRREYALAQIDAQLAQLQKSATDKTQQQAVGQFRQAFETLKSQLQPLATGQRSSPWTATRAYGQAEEGTSNVTQQNYENAFAKQPAQTSRPDPGAPLSRNPSNPNRPVWIAPASKQQTATTVEQPATASPSAPTQSYPVARSQGTTPASSPLATIPVEQPATLNPFVAPLPGSADELPGAAPTARPAAATARNRPSAAVPTTVEGHPAAPSLAAAPANATLPSEPGTRPAAASPTGNIPAAADATLKSAPRSKGAVVLPTMSPTEATIRRVMDGFVEIEAGNDFALEVGQRLGVFRLEPKAQYVGLVSILGVKGQTAIGRVESIQATEGIHANDRLMKSTKTDSKSPTR